MLIVRNGDLFKNVTEPCLIAHGCNAQGKMRSGFAKTLRRLYPKAHLAYLKAYHEDGLSLGDVIFCNLQKVHIANVITQEFYGHDKACTYVDYDAVEKGLLRTKQYAHVNRLPIVLPFIGAGLANGDREVLMRIFNNVLHDVQATLWLN